MELQTPTRACEMPMPFSRVVGCKRSCFQFFNLLMEIAAHKNCLTKQTSAKLLLLFISFEVYDELVKKLEEVRLSESRRSPRLADQERDTDFARLADMAGDRRRSSSHSIDVPMQFTQGNG